MSTDHVLIVGIDGVRYDTLLDLDTPGLDAVTEAGFHAKLRVNDAGPTISGPSWSTILTGVLTPEHGVRSNDFTPNRYPEHPDLVSVARRARPDLATWVASSWRPLVTTDDGGPLFAGGGWHPHAVDHTVEAWRDADAQVIDHSARFLTDHDGSRGSLAFVYLGAPDETAHLLGVGDVYRATIVESDRHLARLLDAVGSRTDEDWTVIVVTDHGHVDDGGHGGETEPERTAWIAARGPGIPVVAPARLEQADVAAHALATLGVAPISPAFIGRPFGTR